MAEIQPISTITSGEMIGRPSTGLDRRVAAAGLLSLVVIAIVLRLVPTVFVPSVVWGDEVYQTIEPAHRLVYGYGLVPWEFQLGMRGWLMPGLVAGLIEMARVFGDGPGYYLAAIATGLALLGSAPVVCVYLWGRREFGPALALVAAAAVAVAPELVYFGARALNEVVGAHLLVVAWYLNDAGRPSSRGRSGAAGFLLATACLLRLQIAPAAAVIALWPGGDGWRSRLPAVIAGAAVAVAVGAGIDWLTLGYPLASVYRNLYYNLYLGVSSGFGVEPWNYYLVGEFGVWMAAAPVAVVLIALGSRRLPVLLVAALALVAVHSAIPHKEYRFIYPTVVLAMVLAAVGLAQLAGFLAERLRQRGLRAATAAGLAIGLLSLVWGAAAYSVWSGATIGGLRARVHDELAAMTFVRNLPAPCGVGLYGENAWVRYGGYTYLHLPVPMYWPKDDAELAATVGAFDTLLSDQAAPPRLGFQQRRCFGKICIAQRPGGCAARPMPPMWFPPRLRATMRPKEPPKAVPKFLAPAHAGRATQ